MATRFEKIKKELRERNNSRPESPLEQWVKEWMPICQIYEYECEYQVDFYFIDIAFPSIKYAVELDGVEFHQDKEKDEKRDEYLRERGWEIKRIPSNECFPNRFMKMRVFGGHLEEIFRKVHPYRKIPWGLAEMLECEGTLHRNRVKEKELVWCNRCEICHVEGNCDPVKESSEIRFGNYYPKI